MSEDVNSDSGWLSTRNKRKISPPSTSNKRRKSVLRRPLSLGEASASYTLNQNSPPPPEIFTHTRQTSIVSFFKIAKVEETEDFAESTEVKTSQTDTSNPLEQRATTQQATHGLGREDFETKFTIKRSGRLDSMTNNNGCDEFKCETPTLPNIKPSRVTITMCNNGLSPPRNVKLSDITTSVLNTSSSPTPSKTENTEESVAKQRKSQDGRQIGMQDLSTDGYSNESIFSSQIYFSMKDSDSSGFENTSSLTPPVMLNESESCTLNPSESLSSQLDSLWKTQNSVQSQTDVNVPLDDSEEPFTFAFLSQDTSLRTRGIIPTGLGHTVKGDNSGNTSEEENFTLTTQSLTSLDERNEVISEDIDDEFTLDSQQFESDDNSLNFDSEPVVTSKTRSQCRKRKEVDRLSGLEVENFLDSEILT